jgi:hypothetical protein
MNHATTVQVNGTTADALINYYMVQKRGDNNKPLWKDENDGIGMCRADVRMVIIYIPITDNKTHLQVSIPMNDILRLAHEMSELKKLESVEFIDE